MSATGVMTRDTEYGRRLQREGVDCPLKGAAGGGAVDIKYTQADGHGRLRAASSAAGYTKQVEFKVKVLSHTAASTSALHL